MKALNRELQRQILERLAIDYPNAVEKKNLPGDRGDTRECIYYLEEHGLVRQWQPDLSSDVVSITAGGLDFLADDGGLGAVLGVVTIRLHEDTIRDLLIKRVEKSEDDPTVKQNVVAKLKALPADALGQLVERALDAGLEKLPKLGTLILSLL